MQGFSFFIILRIKIGHLLYLTESAGHPRGNFLLQIGHHPLKNNFFLAMSSPRCHFRKAEITLSVENKFLKSATAQLVVSNRCQRISELFSLLSSWPSTTLCCRLSEYSRLLTSLSVRFHFDKPNTTCKNRIQTNTITHTFTKKKSFRSSDCTYCPFPFQKKPMKNWIKTIYP